MALDYNPDREGHVDHKWTVIKATKRPVEVNIGGKPMRFGRDGAFRVSDPGVAAEIRKEYGDKGDVTVTRMRSPQPISDRGHRYFFGMMPPLPWHHYDENGRRIKDDGEENSKEETGDIQGQVNEAGRGRSVRDDERRDPEEGRQ
jgi:hypothetical protein